jgi:hypothetical protein
VAALGVLLESPFFISMATVAKFVLLILIFLAYLVPLDVDVTAVGQTLPQLPWKQKRGDFKKYLDSFHQTS